MTHTATGIFEMLRLTYQVVPVLCFGLCILTTRIKVCSHLTDSSPSFAQFNRLLLLLIKWTIKWTNWVETHSARYSAHPHLHNIKQKWPILIKQAKICYV